MGDDLVNFKALTIADSVIFHIFAAIKGQALIGPLYTPLLIFNLNTINIITT